MKALRTALLIAAIIVAAAIAASGFGARFGIWTFGVGFQILTYGAYGALAIAAVALVLLLVPGARRGHAGALAASLVIALCAAGMPLYWRYEAGQLPAINDITTDLANPPEFIAIVPLRAGFPVSAAYGGDTTAQAQRTGYPDIAPIMRKDSPAKAFAAALAVAREMGWTIVASDEQTGRIEATATTTWFGFHDDVVIRVSPAADGSRVDIRSHSRVGRGDLGANARRVRDFTSRLARA